MIRTYCPSCGKEVRIRGGGTEMKWGMEVLGSLPVFIALARRRPSIG